MGVTAQLGEDLNSARGVIFGDYFSVRAYLADTVDGMFGVNRTGSISLDLLHAIDVQSQRIWANLSGCGFVSWSKYACRLAETVNVDVGRFV